MPLEQQLRDHAEQDRVAFLRISEALETIKDNHLAHIEKDVSTLKADTKWQTWLLRLIVGAVIGGFIAQIYQLIG